MSTRRQWSPDEQRAVVPRTNVPPPPPPPELDQQEQEIWRGIVEELPGDWFAPESRPLLKELCRHIRYANDLDWELATVRAALAKLDSGSASINARLRDVARLQRHYHSLLRAHGYQSERIGNLATKLRLTNQSKIVVSTAAKKAKDMPPSGPLPWEDWGKARIETKTDAN
jgi:hypothetical protein